MGAGLARERERSSRQDARDFSNGGTNSISGILRGNLCRQALLAFRGRGPLPQSPLPQRPPPQGPAPTSVAAMSLPACPGCAAGSRWRRGSRAAVRRARPIGAWARSVGGSRIGPRNSPFGVRFCGTAGRILWRADRIHAQQRLRRRPPGGWSGLRRIDPARPRSSTLPQGRLMGIGFMNNADEVFDLIHDVRVRADFSRYDP